jgi:hypothetical protein
MNELIEFASLLSQDIQPSLTGALWDVTAKPTYKRKNLLKTKNNFNHF